MVGVVERKIFTVTGTNVPTEVLFFYKINKTGDWELDRKFDCDIPGHIVRNGMVYETQYTPQYTNVDTSKNHAVILRSGKWRPSLILTV